MFGFWKPLQLLDPAVHIHRSERRPIKEFTRVIKLDVGNFTMTENFQMRSDSESSDDEPPALKKRRKSKNNDKQPPKQTTEQMILDQRCEIDYRMLSQQLYKSERYWNNKCMSSTMDIHLDAKVVEEGAVLDMVRSLLSSTFGVINLLYL
jgi:hypothetical protein